MKKICMAICLFFAATASPVAVEASELIPLQVGIIDPTVPTKPLPKTPVLVPTVYQDGSLLSYDASCVGCVLQIVEEDVVVYSEILSDTQQTTLPTFLSGIYEVQIIQGNYYYYGDITL